MAGAANGIIGDQDPGIELQESTTVDEGIEELKKAARFANSEEFATLKRHFLERMAFYQSYLPSGDPIVSANKTKEEIGNDWVAANIIIAELKAVLDVYERAAEMAKDAASQ